MPFHLEKWLNGDTHSAGKRAVMFYCFCLNNYKPLLLEYCKANKSLEAQRINVSYTFYLWQIKFGSHGLHTKRTWPDLWISDFIWKASGLHRWKKMLEGNKNFTRELNDTKPWMYSRFQCNCFTQWALEKPNLLF